MTLTSLFSHADLQRHFTSADEGGAMAPEDTPSIIAILVGLMDAGESMTVAVIEGELRIVDDVAALEDAACAGALVLAATDKGVAVDVLGDPWGDLATALLPYIEQQNIAVAIDPGALIKLGDAHDLDGGGDSYLFVLDEAPGFAWATGDWNEDGVVDDAFGFVTEEGVSPIVAFTGGVRVATGDVNGDGIVDAVATTRNGDQFIFADGAVRFVSDRVSTEIWSAEGGGIFNDGYLEFDDKAGSEEIFFIGEAADGHDWFTATDDLWL